jgi:hypothetical protein
MLQKRDSGDRRRAGARGGGPEAAPGSRGLAFRNVCDTNGGRATTIPDKPHATTAMPRAVTPEPRVRRNPRIFMSPRVFMVDSPADCLY